MVYHKLPSVLPDGSSTAFQFIDDLKVLAHTIIVQEKLLCQSIWDLWYARTRKRDLIETLFDWDCPSPMTESWIYPQLLANTYATTTIETKLCPLPICVRDCSLQQPSITLIIILPQQQLQMLHEYHYSSIPAMAGMSIGNTTFWQRNQHLIRPSTVLYYCMSLDANDEGYHNSQS